jgi:DNA-binding CsgD family transcriptional regulator
MNTRALLHDHPGACRGRLGDPSNGPDRVEERPLAPFERAALVRSLPTSSDDPLLRLVAMMRMGAMLVAVDGRIAYLNESGKDALDAQIGLALHGDRVVAVMPDIRRRLAQALAQACRAPHIDSALMVSPSSARGAGRPVRVLSMERMTRLSRPGGESLALMCVGAVRQRTPEAAMLAQLFGLTVTEGALMASIASGERLHQCATRRGVSLATVRAQLRNVFVKTGAATQADLMLLAWSVPGLWIN